MTPNQMDLREKYIKYLQPETPMEEEFFLSDEFIKGLSWGKPRKGHPEGAIYLHIKHVFNNIDKLDITIEQRQSLRICALVHDSFKNKEVIETPRDWSKHHALYATIFLSKYTTDETLLGIVKWHDEAYYCWRGMNQKKSDKLYEQRLTTLFDNMKAFIQLYYLFFICDTMTGDKIQAPIHWFENIFLDEIKKTSF